MPQCATLPHMYSGSTAAGSCTKMCIGPNKIQSFNQAFSVEFAHAELFIEFHQLMRCRYQAAASEGQMSKYRINERVHNKRGIKCWLPLCWSGWRRHTDSISFTLECEPKHKHRVHSGDILLQHFRTKPARPQVHLGKKRAGAAYPVKLITVRSRFFDFEIWHPLSILFSLPHKKGIS